MWLIIPLLVTARALVGHGAVFLQISRSAVLQQTVPPEQRGRVGAITNLIQGGPVPIGSLAGGLLGDLVGLRPALFVLAACGLTALPWVAVTVARPRAAPV